MDHITAPYALHRQIEKLSPRQLEIALLLCEGYNAEQISIILSISRQTVMTHIHRACLKMDADNRVRLIVMIAQWQVVKELQNGK